MVSIPIANPAIARPTKSIGMFTAAHWMADPITKTITARFIESFLPTLSERGPLIRDPSQAALCILARTIRKVI